MSGRRKLGRRRNPDKYTLRKGHDVGRRQRFPCRNSFADRPDRYGWYVPNCGRMKRSRDKESAMLRYLVSAAAVFCVLGLAQAADPPEKPGAELHGQWRLQTTNGEKDKYADSADESSLLTFNLEDGTWKLEPRSDAGGFTFFGSFTVDPTQTPKILDAVIQGDGGNTDVFAVYEVTGDTMKLNLRKDGQRAADFELNPEVSTLMTFLRHKTPE
jgi:uncharacterized protein (TIGR03067 family)